jgi:hypothetical protein
VRGAAGPEGSEFKTEDIKVAFDQVADGGHDRRTLTVRMYEAIGYATATGDVTPIARDANDG